MQPWDIEVHGAMDEFIEEWISSLVNRCIYWQMEDFMNE